MSFYISGKQQSNTFHSSEAWLEFIAHSNPHYYFCKNQKMQYLMQNQLEPPGPDQFIWCEILSSVLISPSGFLVFKSKSNLLMISCLIHWMSEYFLLIFYSFFLNIEFITCSAPLAVVVGKWFIGSRAITWVSWKHSGQKVFVGFYRSTASNLKNANRI